MSNQYVVGDSSPYLKRVLIPFWCIRIVVMIIYCFVYGTLVAVFATPRTRDDIEEEVGEELDTGGLIGIAVAILIIVFICLVLDLVCIAKRARRTLKPLFFLIVNIFQTTVWVVLFALSMVGASSGLGIAISVIIFLSFLGVLIYASIIFHKHRKGTLYNKQYIPTHNPAIPEAGYGGYHNTTGYGPPPPNTYQNTGYNGAQQYEMNKPGAPQGSY